MPPSVTRSVSPSPPPTLPPSSSSSPPLPPSAAPSTPPPSSAPWPPHPPHALSAGTSKPPPLKKARRSPPNHTASMSTVATTVTAITATSSPTPPASPPSRRRAPALERLPRWLFYPVRTFVSPRSALPLPHRVEGRGKPFYDWDAWAIALLHPRLWRRRGPWERLVRACREARPRALDSSADVKAALVRIVVAEVVSLLVARAGDALTPEDRNWITSVASRQKGRDTRKPTLMVLFDLAFPVFDLVTLCRSRSPAEPLPPLSPALCDPATNPHAKACVRLHACAMDRAELTLPSPDNGKHTLRTLPPPALADSGAHSAPSEPEGRHTMHTDPVVLGVLRMIGASRSHWSADAASVDQVHVVVEALERLLSDFNAPRWDAPFASEARQTAASIDQLARTLARRLPFRDTHASSPPSPRSPLPPSTTATATATALPVKTKIAFSLWFRNALQEADWSAWAELANDFSYVCKSKAGIDAPSREGVARYIISYLLHDFSAEPGKELDHENVSEDQLDVLSKSLLGVAKASELVMHVRLVIDVAVAFEEFYTLFSESHGNPTAAGPEMQWMATAFENLIHALSVLRDTLLSDGATREQEMIAWSARSVSMATFYSEVTAVADHLADDLHRAVRIAFSEASWPQGNRAYRSSMAFPGRRPQAAEGSEVSAASTPEQTSVSSRPGQDTTTVPAPTTETCGQTQSTVPEPQPAGLQHWILTLNLRDPINLALSIAPWDPRRCLALLDEAISLTPNVMQRVLDGKEGLPLWEFRRVSVGKLLAKHFEGNAIRVTLALERLQSIFDEMSLHKGGNFSCETKRLLEEEVKTGNMCAQTALGLLYSGDGGYWDVARCWACVDKSTEIGASLLYIAAAAGDPEACTGLSHVLATQRSPDGGSPFKKIQFEQVVALFKTAVHTQNRKAVLNVGVLWMYGVPGLVTANPSAATDSFLMALQGAFDDEARCVSAQHLSMCFADGKHKEITAVLSELSGSAGSKRSAALSPLRVDQFAQ